MTKSWVILANDGTPGVVRYETEGLAWRAVHELLEEAFGDNYGEAEINEFKVGRI